MVGRTYATYIINARPSSGCGTLIIVTSRPVILLVLLDVPIMQKCWNRSKTFRMDPPATLLSKWDANSVARGGSPTLVWHPQKNSISSLWHSAMYAKHGAAFHTIFRSLVTKWNRPRRDGWVNIAFVRSNLCWRNELDGSTKHE